MSTTTCNGNLETEFTGSSPVEGKQRGLFSRLLAALHHSRQLQAARELDRHRHLIEEARAYEARNRARQS
jgi:hypothetical protein